MSSFIITVGEKLDMRTQLSDGSFSLNVFTGLVQDIPSERSIMISPPPEHHPDKWIDRVLELTATRKNEIYIALARVEKTVSEGTLHFLLLDVIDGFRRVQRRDFYRLNIKLDIEITGYGKYITENISGNGLAFLSKEKFMEYKKLDININLKNENINVSGIVVRCAEEPMDGKILICINFTEIEEHQQNLITSFIHRQQITLIRKGILHSRQADRI